MLVKTVLNNLLFNKQKKRGCLILLSLLFCVNSMPVYAAKNDGLIQQPKAAIQSEQQDASLKTLPTSLKDIFDVDYYAFLYPDLVLSLGYDKDKLYEHFLKYGLFEGRKCSKVFDIAKYRDMNPDLVAAFGDDFNQYVNHFFIYGVYEGRSCGITAADTMYKAAIADKTPINEVVAKLIVIPAEKIDNSSLLLNAQLSVNISDSGIISDTTGNILIPWELVSREPYLTLESLKSRCGDSLILVTDVDGKITFVGGNFSSVRVSDSASAQESLHCMMQLLEFPEDTRVLELVKSERDTDNNTFYRFVVKTIDGLYFDDTSIVVTSNQNGEVLSVSNSCPNRWNMKNVANVDDGKKLGTYFRKKGYEFLNSEFTYAYDSERRLSYWYNYYLDTETGQLIKMLLFYGPDKIYFYEIKIGDESSYVDLSENYKPYSYLLKDLRETENKDFIDYYGNIVSLPCIKENGKWFIYDKENRLVSMCRANNVIEGKLYFDEDYFSFVEKYKSNPSLADNILSDALNKNREYLVNMIGNALYISAFSTVRNEISRDANKEIWQNENRILPITYENTTTFNNMTASLGFGLQYIVLTNNVIDSYYDGVSHELAHAVYAMITGWLPYQYAIGAVYESYADILGNLEEMMRNGNNTTDTMGYCDKDKWLIGEGSGYATNNNSENFVQTIFSKYAIQMDEYKDQMWLYLRNMSNPEDTEVYMGYQSPSKVGEEGLFIENTLENYERDYGGVHSNNGILSNVCYNMYHKLKEQNDSFGYQQLYDIWFDSMQYINYDTVYSDIEFYIKQSMINKNYSSEAIEATMKCFEDANVSDYVPNKNEHSYISTEEGHMAAFSSVESNLEQIPSNAEEVPTDSVEAVEDIREEIADAVDAVEKTSETIADAEEAVEEASETITDAEETLVDTECVAIGGM